MGKRIVLADDERDIVKFLTVRMVKRGYEVSVAVNGREAWELISTQKPDLAILDIRMPFIDGLEVCKRIKADPRLKSIPVILITASSTNITAAVLKSVQADDCLIKPFEAEELLSRLDRLTA